MNYGKKVEKVVITDGYGIEQVLIPILTSGEVCRVDYQKSDGDLTTMLCRTGVHCHAKGTGKSPTNLAENRLSVWSFDRQGYRTLKLNKILTLKHGGILYDFRNVFATQALKEGKVSVAMRLAQAPGEYGIDLTGRTVDAKPGYVLK
jgi:hypothetical protein